MSEEPGVVMTLRDIRPGDAWLTAQDWLTMVIAVIHGDHQTTLTTFSAGDGVVTNTWNTRRSLPPRSQWWIDSRDLIR